MVVRPSISCGNCGSPVALNDKFCAKCGTALSWDDENSAADKKVIPPSTIVCPSCGVSNSTTNSVCLGCGTNLTGVTSVPQASPTSKKRGPLPSHQSAKKGSAGKKTESWKTLSVAGAVVVLVLVGLGVFRNPPKEIVPQNQSLNAGPDAGISPTLMTDIDALQKTVEANPKDTESLLRLANALHDAKFMPRAIETYKKYLLLKPSDPDARVDMAICYFESGDSPTALKEMQTALKHDPKHQMAMYNIGIVNLNQGNLEQSNEWFRKAIALDPMTQIAQRAQQILTQHSTIQQ